MTRVRVDIDTDEFHEELEAIGNDLAKEAANRWYSWSQEDLFQAGDQHDYDTHSVAQSATPPQETNEGWRFEYPHIASIFFEFGTTEHEVEAVNADVLAFEWENAPPEVREDFEDTFPTVFMPKTEPSGIPALRYLRDSREEVRRWLREQA